jgi:hypothetical protein
MAGTVTYSLAWDPNYGQKLVYVILSGTRDKEAKVVESRTRYFLHERPSVTSVLPGILLKIFVYI